ncbi:hypothetical protein [Paracoccus haematequi]|nr:hypothetical protein [Paracoccus haematequi]
MARIVNKSQAVRVVNVKDGDKVRQAHIAPGASLDGEPVKTKGFAAAVVAGHLSVEADKPAPKADDRK